MTGPVLQQIHVQSARNVRAILLLFQSSWNVIVPVLAGRSARLRRPNIEMLIYRSIVEQGRISSSGRDPAVGLVIAITAIVECFISSV